LTTLQELDRRLRRLEERLPDNSSGWAGNQANVTTDRTFDADTVLVAELADIVGTLIADLIEAGVLK